MDWGLTRQPGENQLGRNLNVVRGPPEGAQQGGVGEGWLEGKVTSPR